MKNEWGFALDLDFKAVSDEGEFAGYAAVFGNEDLGRDVLLPGAFTKSLARRPAARVKMLRQHDPEEPIGIWLDLAEDKKGLRAKGRLILDTTRSARGRSCRPSTAPRRRCEHDEALSARRVAGLAAARTEG